MAEGFLASVEYGIPYKTKISNVKTAILSAKRQEYQDFKIQRSFKDQKDKGHQGTKGTKVRKGPAVQRLKLINIPYCHVVSCV